METVSGGSFNIAGLLHGGHGPIVIAPVTFHYPFPRPGFPFPIRYPVPRRTTSLPSRRTNTIRAGTTSRL
jgi:hypothetical protein